MTTINSSVRDLQQLGLSKNVALVYFALVELDGAKAGEIIKRTGLHRHLVYLALESLMKKKLIAKIDQNGVAYYKLLDVSHLLSEVKSKEVLAKQLIEQFRAKHKPPEQEIVVYEGIEEVRAKELESYERMRKTEVMRYLGNSPHWFEVMGESLTEHLAKLQQKIGFQIQCITSQKMPEHDFFLPSKLTHIKILPHISSDISEIQIFHDQIMIKQFVEPYSVIQIINPLIAKSYNNYFEELWKKA